MVTLSEQLSPFLWRGKPGLAREHNSGKTACTSPGTLPCDSNTTVLDRIISHKGIKNTVIYNILKAAWASYGPVKMSELNESTMKFEFESNRDRKQILDLSPWSIQGHSFNLKECSLNACTQDVDFGSLQVWIQIVGLSSDM